MARYIIAVLMAVALTLPSLAGDPDAGSFYEIEGLVNSVQYNYFTVLGYKNTVERVMLKNGANMPNEIMSGVKIRLIAVKDSVGQYVLYEIESVSKTELPMPTPIPILPPLPLP